MTVLNQSIQTTCVSTLAAVSEPRSLCQTEVANRPLALVKLWLARSRQRRELASLPAHLLKDIGLCEAQRQQEVSKPFWR